MRLNMKTITIRDDVYKSLGYTEFENKDKLIAEIRKKRAERRY